MIYEKRVCVCVRGGGGVEAAPVLRFVDIHVSVVGRAPLKVRASPCDEKIKMPFGTQQIDIAAGGTFGTSSDSRSVDFYNNQTLVR